MICRKCGIEIADKALICYRCGTATREPVHAPPSTDEPQARPVIPIVLALVMLGLAAFFLLPGRGTAWGAGPTRRMGHAGDGGRSARPASLATIGYRGDEGTLANA